MSAGFDSSVTCSGRGPTAGHLTVYQAISGFDSRRPGRLMVSLAKECCDVFDQG